MLNARGWDIHVNRRLHIREVGLRCCAGQLFSVVMAQEWRKLNIFNLKCQMSICRVNRCDRLRNNEVMCSVGVRKKMSGRVDRKI